MESLPRITEAIIAQHHVKLHGLTMGCHSSLCEIRVKAYSKAKQSDYFQQHSALNFKLTENHINTSQLCKLY